MVPPVTLPANAKATPHTPAGTRAPEADTHDPGVRGADAPGRDEDNRGPSDTALDTRNQNAGDAGVQAGTTSTTVDHGHSADARSTHQPITSADAAERHAEGHDGAHQK